MNYFCKLSVTHRVAKNAFWSCFLKKNSRNNFPINLSIKPNQTFEIIDEFFVVKRVCFRTSNQYPLTDLFNKVILVRYNFCVIYDFSILGFSMRTFILASAIKTRLAPLKFPVKDHFGLYRGWLNIFHRGRICI